LISVTPPALPSPCFFNEAKNNYQPLCKGIPASSNKLLRKNKKIGFHDSEHELSRRKRRGLSKVD